ncbi:TauD/TfdA family dioxygenase [Duganella sp. CT11-25]|uniref:TauD/TfdA family dioxygenase n=1 Tax=unclassified Duganella TaxID=2636909 RepID=UPI0039B0AA60
MSDLATPFLSAAQRGTGSLPELIQAAAPPAAGGAPLPLAPAAIIDQARRRGALLFRGFGIDNPEAFARATGDIVPGLAAYRGGTSPRTRLEDGVYTSTEYPHQLEISLHNEMSYSHRAPEFIFFACVVAPASAGQTPIADCRRVLERLPDALVAQFERRGVMYERNLFGRDSPYNPWSKAFETDDPAVVEQHCRAADIQFEWTGKDQLRTREIRPAICRHPVTGEPVWFNQVNLWHYTNSPLAKAMGGRGQAGLPMNAFFGDGAPLPAEALELIRAAYAAEKVLFSWQAGDFLMLDNRLCAHGRMPFEGPRKIIVAMGDAS